MPNLESAGGVSGRDRLRVLSMISDLTTGEYGGYQAVLAIHAEGSIEAEKLTILAQYNRRGATDYARWLAGLDDAQWPPVERGEEAEDGGFEQRIALVTGGGRGIGRAIATALAAEGAAVGVVARTTQQCEMVAAEIGERALAITADVSDPESCLRAVAALTERFGAPGVLVNAAGISPIRGRAERQDPATFAQIININLIGAFTMMHAAAEALGETGGSVVNVASTLGVAASPLLSAYGASKAGLIQLTRTLAREWASRSVRVNALCPGYVETDLTARMLTNDSIRESIFDQTPMRRLAEMREVVEPALFLASDDASYITGAALIVDGGFSA